MSKFKVGDKMILAELINRLKLFDKDMDVDSIVIGEDWVLITPVSSEEKYE